MSIHKHVNFTKDDIDQVASIKNLNEARQAMIEIIERASPSVSKSPMNPRKIAFLKNRVNTRNTVEQIVAIGYNMLLVGEGLGSNTGSYQKLFR